jgi:hypothetical protein
MASAAATPSIHPSIHKVTHQNAYNTLVLKDDILACCWLVLRLEISYRVKIIYRRILVAFRGFF